MNADELALLARIADDVHALRLAAERGATAATALRKEQADALAMIVPVLAGAFGDARFSCFQPVDLARQNTSEGANLRLALAGRNARQLGKLLQVGQAHEFDGLRIERAGEDGNGVLWKCIGSHFPSAPRRARP